MIGALVAGITGSGGASLSSYESIATATGTGSSGTITFSSIPSTFKHLQIRGIDRSDTAATITTLYIRANGDTANNYAWHQLAGDGASAYANGTATTDNIFGGNPVAASSSASIMGTRIIDVLDYGSTSKNKTFRNFVGHDLNGSGRVQVTSGVWLSTSAITSISLVAAAGNWTTATTFALYGIKEA